MKKHAILTSLLLLCDMAFLSPANTNYQFIHFNKAENDLSYDGVKTMIQDSRGFVWIGTYRGLSRYDGTRFRNYTRYDWGIDSDSIISLAEDGNGNIWIGTEDGIVTYDYLTDSFIVSDAPESPKDRVYCISRGLDQEMWIASRDGLYMAKTDGPKFEHISLDIAGIQAAPLVYKVLAGLDGRVYFSIYCDNLYVLDNVSGEIYPLVSDYFKDDDIEGLALSEDNPNLLYVASKRHGLCSVNLHTFETKAHIIIPGDRRPMSVSCSGHFVWFSTSGGVYRYNPANEEITHISHNPEDPFSISDNAANCCVMDSAGGLWVSTENGGVNYSSAAMLNFKRIFSLDNGESLRGVYVKSIAQDSDGTVWIGTERMGLLCFCPETGSIDRYRDGDGLPNDINALCAENDILWIGSHGGIFRLDAHSSSIKSYNNIFEPKANSDNRVVSIFLSNGGDLYVGTNLGVSLYDRLADCFVKIDVLEGITVEHMGQDVSGNIWMATYSQGVYVYNPERREIIRTFSQKNDNSVIPEMTSSICIDAKGDVWVIGFSAGFFRFNKTDFDVFSMSSIPALTTDVYYLALQDNSGQLWLSSNDGLICFNPTNGRVKRFTRYDGLLSDIFKKAGMRLRDSRIMLGCDNGLILFDPAVVGSGGPSLNTTISDIYVNGNRSSKFGNINTKSKIILDHKERNVKFELSSPGFPSHADECILCKLSGYEDDWRDVTASRSVNFYNIPKGEYTLQIATVLANGTLAYTHPPLSITVRPSFFESALGLSLLSFLILIFALMLFYFIYKNALEAQKAKHKEAEKVMQEQLYQEKMSFFADVIHELKTPLTIIQTPLMSLMRNQDMPEEQKQDIELIGNNADYLNKLVKELLEFITVEEHGYVLDFQNIDIVERMSFICSNYYELAKARNLKLDYTPGRDSFECAVDPKALSKIANNLLHNAIKYASSFISVVLSTDADTFSITFRNDGTPIPKERRESIFSPFVHFGVGNNGEQSFGIGLPLAKKLAELHGGTLMLSDCEQYTEFILTMPIKSIEAKECETSSRQEEGQAEYCGKPVILLVEDNPDLLTFLSRKLSPDYKVIGVPSAEKALEKMLKTKIDLLITDIGLKAMSGVELCARVNNSPEYAHIPIIVLSAISTLKTKIQCMKNGASMYIEKPFSLDYLVSCIDSVFEKRKSMKNAYSHVSDTAQTLQVDLTNRDEDFVRRLDELVTANIGDPNFTNKQIEEYLYVSHSSLNRKMKALLKTTANDYIRTKRLALAAQMISRGGVRISEVCYAVGFNSPSYFAKCFKAAYGMSPAEFAKEKIVSTTDKKLVLPELI